MSINNILCKYFKKNEDGYVTIGSILSGWTGLILWLNIIPTLLRLAYFDEIPTADRNIMDVVYIYFNTLFYTIVFMIVVTAILKIIEYICNIKLAKCPLVKEQEIKEEVK
jgi:hypothetical protein